MRCRPAPTQPNGVSLVLFVDPLPDIELSSLHEDDAMLSHWKTAGAVLVLGLGLLTWPLLAAKPNEEGQREAAQKAARSGNYKEAYETIRKLALDPACAPAKVGADLDLG